MGEYSYILEQQGKTTSEKLAEFTAAIGWRDELATYRIAQDEYEMRAAAVAEQGISLLDEPPYTDEELAALDAELAAYYDAFAANYVATTAFSGSGSGTAEDPYIITNRAQLEAINDDLTAYYQLSNDIDLGGSSSPWTPIGTASTPFTGTLDGNGYTISNVYLSPAVWSSNSFSGVFAAINGATIQNTAVVVVGMAAMPTGYPMVGGLVGTTVGSSANTISRCYASFTATPTAFGAVGGGIGGILGANYYNPTSSTQSILIENCYADVQIDDTSGTIAIGGIAGTYFRHIIQNSYANVDISTPTNSVRYAAGVAGNIHVDLITLPSFSRVFALGSISGPTEYTHRISGRSAPYSGSTGYAASDMLVNGAPVSGGSGLATADGLSVDPSTYHTQAFWQNTLGWDFQNVWYWDDTEQLPKLRVFLHGPTITSVSATPTTGGTTTQITLSATVQDATSYQWQYSLNSGGSWQDITGATAATSTWTPGAVGTYQVRLLATNSDGTTISGPVTVTIYPDPTISDVTIYPNPSDESATFLISAVVNES